MRKIVLVLFFLLILGCLWIFREEILKKIEDTYQLLSLRLPEIQFKVPKIENSIEPSQIFTPPPLKVEKEETGFLTKEGVIYWTNIQRKNYKLLPLKENELLNESARLKLKDMFENQYFDHVSPEGKKLKDLEREVGYEFIVIGENLAMGNFKDDEDLVLSWMESPGHRENILNEKYQEIGVAVGEGFFEGKKVWMAVQHFGKPLSACPQPKEELKLRIEENQRKLEELLKEIEILEYQIKTIRPKWREDLREKIDEYNNLVSEYNQLLDQTQNLIFQYNNQVKIFNDCLSQ